MIKAQTSLSSEMIDIDIQKELDRRTFRHPTGSYISAYQTNYDTFERSDSFWIDDVNYSVKEIKKSKWYQKQPHYRTVGKSTYELTITTWDENGKNPKFDRQMLPTISKIERAINDHTSI